MPTRVARPRLRRAQELAFGKHSLPARGKMQGDILKSKTHLENHAALCYYNKKREVRR